MRAWSAEDVPSLKGRSAVVTGTGGLGFHDAIALCHAGAHVIIAGRNSEKGAESVGRIRQLQPEARVRFEVLDLADLRSVRAFAERLSRDLGRLDILINNAGIMMIPTRQTTMDGFELQLGTNYLGPFALTALLLPLLSKTQASRVVTVSSLAAAQGKIDFADLQAETRYSALAAYSRSKLADLIFAFELQRRSDLSGWGIASMAAHPGLARTDLLANGAGRGSFADLSSRLLWFLFQPPAKGALSTLYAATSEEAKGGCYYGPGQMGGLRGAPGLSRIPHKAKDAVVASRLWEISESLTGVSFPRSL
jgi:NAD(P)-dependent dehydrogenase (short-subunit alcohol dehydrogenase family)